MIKKTSELSETSDGCIDSNGWVHEHSHAVTSPPATYPQSRKSFDANSPVLQGPSQVSHNVKQLPQSKLGGCVFGICVAHTMHTYHLNTHPHILICNCCHHKCLLPEPFEMPDNQICGRFTCRQHPDVHLSKEALALAHYPDSKLDNLIDVPCDPHSCSLFV